MTKEKHKYIMYKFQSPISTLEAIGLWTVGLYYTNLNLNHNDSLGVNYIQGQLSQLNNTSPIVCRPVIDLITLLMNTLRHR